MAQSTLNNCRIAGIATAVPDNVFDNQQDIEGFSPTEVRKVIAMAGVKQRFVSDGTLCASDLCLQSARELLSGLQWAPDTIDAMILITHSPDYFQPATVNLVHRDLGLSVNCATFDVGLGCSGYPYGLWLAGMMINSGMKRVLVLHGETPSRYASPEDRATYLLFGDAGSATAVERDDSAQPWHFSLHTDGQGYDDLIIRAGAFRNRFSDVERDYYLEMDGSGLFSFTIERVPPLIEDTLQMAGVEKELIDYFIFHQSNQFMMKHLAKKCGLDVDKTPIILEKFGNTGGPSVPLTVTQAVGQQGMRDDLKMLMLGYGVGLSWSSALVSTDASTVIKHSLVNKRCIGE